MDVTEQKLWKCTVSELSDGYQTCVNTQSRTKPTADITANRPLPSRPGPGAVAHIRPGRCPTVVMAELLDQLDLQRGLQNLLVRLDSSPPGRPG